MRKQISKFFDRLTNRQIKVKVTVMLPHSKDKDALAKLNTVIKSATKDAIISRRLI
jgi:hypothetical protein